MSGHIDIRTLSDYFLNRLTSEEETAVQEHLSVCPECRARLEAMRRLRRGMFGEEESSMERRPVFFRVLRSGWTKAAAAVILICGIGIFTYDTVRNRSNVAPSATGATWWSSTRSGTHATSRTKSSP